MSDLISRNDAVEAIKFKKIYMTAYKNGYVSEGNPLKQYNKGLDDAIKAVNSLAPAKPERKKGYWTEDSDPGQIIGEHYSCSECRACFGTLKSNFCPHCGADMRGE